MVKYEFPNDFIWGVASSAYQIEGAWNEDGKGESIWDRFVHIPGNIKDNTTGDVCCDFYNRYEEDIALMKKLGYPSFLCTISWARVIPNGTGEVNPEGIAFYRNVLKCLRANGIKSYVALYHWDLPQKLQERGGWLNREIVSWFEEYAKTMYRELGDLVDNWITLVEPYATGIAGYWMGKMAPGYRDYSAAMLATHHLNLSHGAAVKAFRECGCPGEIGIKVSMQMTYPSDPANADDVLAAKLRMYEAVTVVCDPILKGEYPQEYFDYLKAKGIVIPQILPGDMELMNQKLDFFGLNNYYTEYVDAKGDWPLYFRRVKSGKPMTSYNWEFCPEGFYEIIKWFNDRYHPAKLIITENGCSSIDWEDEHGKVDDPVRVTYLRNYLKYAHRAIAEGIPLAGYFVWSFTDNFEWTEGLALRFGLVHVNYQTLKRTPKTSAYWYSKVIENNGFED